MNKADLDKMNHHAYANAKESAVRDTGEPKEERSLSEVLSELERTRSEAAERRRNLKKLEETIKLMEGRLIDAEAEAIAVKEKNAGIEDWKAAAKKATREKQEIMRQHTTEKLEAALLSAGAIDAQIAKLVPTENLTAETVAEAVASFKESQPQFFGAPVVAPSAAPQVRSTGSDHSAISPSIGGVDVRGITDVAQYEAMKAKALSN